MSFTLTLWVVIFAVGALTYLSRLSFIALFARYAMPPLVTRALRFVPAAMLAAIVVPAVAIPTADNPDPTLATAKLVAAGVAVLIAWRWRSPTLTMALGMVALWATQFALRAAG